MSVGAGKCPSVPGFWRVYALSEIVRLSVGGSEHECIPESNRSTALNGIDMWNFYSPHQSLFSSLCDVHPQECCEKYGEEGTKTTLAVWHGRGWNTNLPVASLVLSSYGLSCSFLKKLSSEYKLIQHWSICTITICIAKPNLYEYLF